MRVSGTVVMHEQLGIHFSGIVVGNGSIRTGVDGGLGGMSGILNCWVMALQKSGKIWRQLQWSRNMLGCMVGPIVGDTGPTSVI